jgi:hypothetical protein
MRVQEFRSSGVQEFRSSGVQEFRSSGVQEFRSSGVQEFRSSGVQGGTRREIARKSGFSDRNMAKPSPVCRGLLNSCNSLNSLLIIPFQQIIGHPKKHLGPFAKGAQSFSRFFG